MISNRRNLTADWVISKQRVHAALVSEQDFVAAQAVRCHRTADDGTMRSYFDLKNAGGC